MKSGKFFILFQQGEGLGNPDATPLDGGQTTGSLVGTAPPPAASTDGGIGQLIQGGSVLASLVVGFLVYRSVRDGAVARMEAYDKATRNGLVAGIAVAVLLAIAAQTIIPEAF